MSPASENKDGGLSRLQIRRALRIWTVEGSVSTVFGTLTTGAFQTGFALYLGCSEFVIGILAAIPAFVGLLQLVSSYFAERYGERKRIVIWFALVARLLWIPLLLIPFVLPRPAWVLTFLILTTLSYALMNVAAPLWMAWITDIVPGDNRGRYFGRRNMIAGIVGLVVSVGGGWFLDASTRRHVLAEPTAFAVIFGSSLVFALWSFGLGRASPDVMQTARAEHGEKAGLRGALAYYAAPFGDKNFRRIMAFAGGVIFAQAVSGQFFTVYQLKNLGLSYTALQLLGAAASLSSLAAMPLWGYLSDKYGAKPMLMIGSALVVLLPFFWLFPVRDGISGLWAFDADGALRVSWTKVIIVLINLLAGLGWAGVGLAQFNLMISAAPAAQRTVYVSAIAAVSGLAGGVAPLIGGAILEGFAHVAFPAHGLVRNNYHVLFLISVLARFALLVLAQPIREAGGNTTRYVLGQLKASKPIGSFTSLQKLARGASATARTQAAEELGRLKTPVAVEELVKALDDVALPVREQAAVALGEIGDGRATASLVRKLTDPASGITHAAATALGKIGDKDALPALAAAAQLGPATRQLAALEALGRLRDARVTDVLTALVENPDPSVRLSALRALAEREDLRAAPLLLRRLDAETDPATLAVLADALGRLEDADAVVPLLRALDKTSSPGVRREILNAVGSVLGGRDAFYPYLALEPSARDETVGKALLTLQRRFLARATRERQPGSARLAVRARQALAAYVEGDSAGCIVRLSQLAHALPEPVGAGARRALGLLQMRAQQAGRDTSMEEALLAVFLARPLADARAKS